MAVAELDVTRNYDARWTALEEEYSSWKLHYRDISETMMPRNGRFIASDRGRAGAKKHNLIYDNTATVALRTAGAGITAYGMSPARPFFRFRVRDKKLNRALSVRKFLGDAVEVCLNILAEADAYRTMHAMNEELVAFGTSAALMLEDDEHTMRLHHLTVGEYRLAVDHTGKVDTCYRTFEMTVYELVNEFGFEACSTAVQELFKTPGGLDKRRTVRHVIEPRKARNPMARDNKNMPWASVYYEVGSRESQGKVLRETGFDYFPVLAVRWTTIGMDAYGSDCPGMLALGDARQLQHEQLRKGQGIDFKTIPAMQGPPEMKGQEHRWVPGGVVYTGGGATQGLRSAFETTLDLSDLREDIGEVQARIYRACFADLFRLLSETRNDPRKSATEVQHLDAERLTQLGPAIERINTEMLAPLLRFVLRQADATGRLPDLPPELAGQRVAFEFVSVLAQAQRAVSVSSLERALVIAGGLAGAKPQILDNIDEDEVWNEVSDMLGVPPRITRDPVDRTKLRQAAINAQSAQAQAEMQATQSQTAKNLGEVAAAPIGANNALSDVVSLFSGYNSPNLQQPAV